MLPLRARVVTERFDENDVNYVVPPVAFAVTRSQPKS